jgi:hypothetical protein
MTVSCRVGAHRLTGEPTALMPGQRLFTFAAGTEPSHPIDGGL